jgi:ankyrin repeat protein
LILSSLLTGTGTGCATAPKEAGSAANETASADGVTPLMAASFRGSTEEVRRLLAAGADPKAVDKQGQSALHYAALARNSSVCGLLTKAGAEVNKADNSEELTPLMLAVRFGHPQCITELIAAGAHINALEPSGWSALYFAIPRGDINIVEELLASGATVNGTDNEGWTPLHIAAIYFQPKIYDLLKSRGAKENIKDKDGKTPPQLMKQLARPTKTK